MRNRKNFETEKYYRGKLKKVFFCLSGPQFPNFSDNNQIKFEDD